MNDFAITGSRRAELYTEKSDSPTYPQSPYDLKEGEIGIFVMPVGSNGMTQRDEDGNLIHKHGHVFYVQNVGGVLYEFEGYVRDQGQGHWRKLWTEPGAVQGTFYALAPRIQEAVLTNMQDFSNPKDNYCWGDVMRLYPGGALESLAVQSGAGGSAYQMDNIDPRELARLGIHRQQSGVFDNENGRNIIHEFPDTIPADPNRSTNRPPQSRRSSFSPNSGARPQDMSPEEIQRLQRQQAEQAQLRHTAATSLAALQEMEQMGNYGYEANGSFGGVPPPPGMQFSMTA